MILFLLFDIVMNLNHTDVFKKNLLAILIMSLRLHAIMLLTHEYIELHIILTIKHTDVFRIKHNLHCKS